MLQIVEITFPIFAIVGLGYALTLLKVFSHVELEAMGKFVMFLALPLLLFHATATRSFAELIDPGFLLILVLAGLMNQAITWTILRLRGIGPGRRAAAVLGVATPNSAFLSFPIMSMIFPEHAASILAMCLLSENFVMNPLGLTLIEASRSGPELSRLRRSAQLILSVLRRPMILGLILGALYSLSGLTLPSIVERPINLISLSASPLALFFTGGRLVGLPFQGNFKLAGFVSAMKLVMHPALVALLIGVFTLLALPVPAGHDMKIALILSTAMPVFSVYPLLATDSGHSGMAALVVLICTVAAFFTLTLLMTLLL